MPGLDPFYRIGLIAATAAGNERGTGRPRRLSLGRWS
jgi:hypothetical protein